jgi:hypothetical protein
LAVLQLLRAFCAGCMRTAGDMPASAPRTRNSTQRDLIGDATGPNVQCKICQGS